MKRGFYTIMAAQFLSSLADNALLIAAMALLIELQSPAWMIPLLKLFFTVSYVVLAPLVGAFADSRPKGQVMLLTNAIKIVGCLMLFWTVHPLLAYAVVGFGAAAYSPAKYGILTELLPPEKLVVANGWIEGTTVLSIILGTLLGGALIGPRLASHLLAIDIPRIDTGVDTPAEAAIAAIAVIYLLAGLFNMRIPDTGVRYPNQHLDPMRLVGDFWRCNVALWRDKLGQVALAVTTLFWGVGATLQFIVLKWAQEQLNLRLDQAALLQGIVAVGVAIGAVVAAGSVPLKRSLRVLTAGVLMGLMVPIITLIHQQELAWAMLVVIGCLAGFFVVPMNALLQHRGYVLMSAGHSIAVQNFNENLNILLMLSVYSILLKIDLPINSITLIFGATITLVMVIVIARHRANQRVFDSEALIGEPAPARIAQPVQASTLANGVDDEPVAQHGEP
jgi:MFS family permease